MINFRVDIDFDSSSATNLFLNADSYNRLSSFKGGGLENGAINGQNNNYRRFILGKTILGTNGAYSGNYLGLYGNVGSSNVLYDINDVSKGYKINDISGKYSFTITGENITFFKMGFDSSQNSYATVIRINGELYYNKEFEFEYTCDSTNNIVVEILALNDSNIPVMIKQIKFSIALVISYSKDNGLIGFTRGSQSTPSNELPEFAIISQYGSVNLVDYNDIIIRLIKENKLNKNLVVKIYNNNIIIGTYETSKDLDYNVHNKEVSINLHDNLLKLQEIFIEKKDIQYDVTAFQIYNYLKEQTSGFNWELDDELVNYLNNVLVPYFYLDKESIWNQWNKFLQLVQCVMYSLPNGTIKIKRRM